MSIDFFTRLPLHGETRHLPGDPRNRGDWQAPSAEGGALSDFQPGDDFTYIDYLGQIARAAEINGFGGVLMVNTPFGEEPWTVCSLLARETRKLKFVSAFQPYHFSPFAAAQMAATYQRASGNRLVWNIINGGSEVIQRQVGDFTDHDDRYLRASEFLDVVKGYWHQDNFHYQGKYYQAEGGSLSGPHKKAELPLICTAGSSEAARELAAKHADYYLMRAERPEEIRELIEDVRRRAIAHGNPGIRFGLSVDVITRPSDDEAFAEAKRYFDEGIAKGVVKTLASHAGLRSARKLGFEHEYAEKSEQSAFDDFFIHPNVWSGLGYVGLPPGVALVGSYANVVERIREYHAIGIDLFFLAGYPHLEESYRIGEHILPHFRAERRPASRTVVSDTPRLQACNGGVSA